MAIWPATNWFLAIVEIKRPMLRAVIRNSIADPKSTNREPRSGTSKSHTAMTTERVMPPIPSTK